MTREVKLSGSTTSVDTQTVDSISGSTRLAANYSHPQYLLAEVGHSNLIRKLSQGSFNCVLLAPPAYNTYPLRGVCTQINYIAELLTCEADNSIVAAYKQNDNFSKA